MLAHVREKYAYVERLLAGHRHGDRRPRVWRGWRAHA
jgi:hypothetical protein